MKNNVGKFVVVLASVLGAHNVACAADLPIGSFIVPVATAHDGCTPTISLTEQDNCTTINVTPKTLQSDGTCTSGTVTSKRVCSGEAGRNACAPLVKMVDGSQSGCTAPQIQNRKWDETTGACVNDGTPTTGANICNGNDGNDYNPCDGLSTAQQQTTVRYKTENYTAPAGISTGEYGTKYATEVGYKTVVTNYCSGQQTTDIKDSCVVVHAETPAISNLPNCGGVISQCVRGDTKTTYYMCGAQCVKSTSVYTGPSGGASDSSHAISYNNNSSNVYTVLGKTTITEKNGCGQDAASKTYEILDECEDSEIDTVSNVTYIYRTCTDRSSKAQYKFRQALSNLDKNVYKILKDTQTVASKAIQRPTTTGTQGQVLTWDSANNSATWADGVQVQMTTFDDADSTGKIFYCTKTSGTCSTSSKTDGWASFGVDTLNGADGKTPYVRYSTTSGSEGLQVCLSDTECAPDDTRWTQLTSDLTGPKGDTGSKGNKGDKGEKGDTGESALDIYRAETSNPTATANDMFNALMPCQSVELVRNAEYNGEGAQYDLMCRGARFSTSGN